jgi:hypothetical protein
MQHLVRVVNLTTYIYTLCCLTKEFGGHME